MQQLKIGTSSVRGVVGESITPELIVDFACAFGTYCDGGQVVIGRDTRQSSGMLRASVLSSLISCGCEVVDLGVCPTPMVSFAVRELQAAGGLSITGSHNPIQWNALKFFGPDGIILRPNQAAELVDLYHQGVYTRVPASEIREVHTNDDTIRLHREAILRTVDVAAIRARNFRVAVDCCNGAASFATPEFLRALDCEVIELYTNPDEPFPRNPEPIPENLGELCRVVRESRADIGFAQDADADRLAIVDEHGAPLGEECTLALAMRHVLKNDPRARAKPVVVNISSSRMNDDVAKQFGCRLIYTRVGEVNVVEAMLAAGALIGGEGNGGVIAPHINPCRDSFVGMAFILEALAKEGGSIGQMRAKIPSYSIVKMKVECPMRQVAPALRALQEAYRNETLDLIDGLKIIRPDRWVQARGSNTEPIIRITSEAPGEVEARALANEVIDHLERALGRITAC